MESVKRAEPKPRQYQLRDMKRQEKVKNILKIGVNGCVTPVI